MAVKSLFLVLVLTCLMEYATAARNDLNDIKPGQNLAARLDANSGRVMECWNGLVQLKSCSNVFVNFFPFRDGYNSPECCRAVQTVDSKCWPTNLTSFGFMSQEVNILKGVCGASSPAPVAAPPSDAVSPASPSAAGTPIPAASPIST